MLSAHQRGSHLLLAFLSPSYLQSETFEWGFNEFIEHHIGRAYVGDSVVPNRISQTRHAAFDSARPRV